MTILTPDDVLNSRFVGDFGRLRPFVAPRAVVVAERFESAHSLCDIQWGSDGSVYLLFPYLQDVPGIVSRASLQNGHAGSHTITLAETARTTSNVVKLSHHRSGIAQLSQSGRTTSEIRVSSLPLDGGNGRIFEVTAFNPLEYPTTSLADRPLERVHLRTMFSRGMPPAVSVVALWFRCDELAQRLPAGQTAGPHIRLRRRDETEDATWFLLANPKATPAPTHVLAVSCAPAATVDWRDEAALVLLAGFPNLAPESPALDGPVDLLLAAYPWSRYEELTKRLGTIDLKVNTRAAASDLFP